MHHVLIAMILVGCGSSAKATDTQTGPAPTTGAAGGDARTSCAAAVSKAATTGRGDETFTPEDQKLNAEIETAMTDSCVATTWGPHVLACLSNGTSRDELRMCPEMLTPVQREDFMERILVVTKAHEAATTPAP